MSFDTGEELFCPQSDDVCYNKNGELGKFENDPSQRLSIPFVGYSYYKKTRFNYYIEKILKDEGITPKDFFSKEMQEIPFNSIAVREPKTLVFFFIQLLDMFLS